MIKIIALLVAFLDSDFLVVVFRLFCHGIIIILSFMVYAKLLIVEIDHIFFVEAEALSEADPEKQHIDYFNSRVLEVVYLESASFFGFFAPVFPECAVSEFFQLIAHCHDIVVEHSPPYLGSKFSRSALASKPVRLFNSACFSKSSFSMILYVF